MGQHSCYKVGQVLRLTEDARDINPIWDLDVIVVGVLDKHSYACSFDNDVSIYIDDRDGCWEVIA